MRGCEVNGWDEAKKAAIGQACGGEYAVIFREGELLRPGRIAKATKQPLGEIGSHER